MVENLDIAAIVLAVGAIGTASFGLVDAIKAAPGLSRQVWGFKKVMADFSSLGPILEATYGPEWQQYLREQYNHGRAAGDAPGTVREGIRAGLGFVAMEDDGRDDLARALANYVGGMSPDDIVNLAEALRSEDGLGSKTEALLARFELALELRVRGTFAAAERVYRSSARSLAVLMAILVSFAGFAAAGFFDAEANGLDPVESGLVALLVGIVAVPLAPISKDLATALSKAVSAANTLRGR